MNRILQRLGVNELRQWHEEQIAKSTPAAKTRTVPKTRPAPAAVVDPEPVGVAEPAPEMQAAPATTGSGAVGDVLLLGHGWLELDAHPTKHSKVMDEVLIPPNTTLKFYTVEHGVPLNLGNYLFHQRWRDLRPGWKPLGPKSVTYNYKLAPDDAGLREQAKALDWGGAKIVSLKRGSAGRHLCEGTPETCPTPALLAAEKAGKTIPPERWKHNCKGLLGKYQGQNLHWMACTQIEDETLADAAMIKYLQRGSGATLIEASGIALLNPEELVVRLREVAARMSKLSDTAAATKSDIQSADAFVTEVAELFTWADKHLTGTDAFGLMVKKLVEAGSFLSGPHVLDDDAAQKVAQLAQKGLPKPETLRVAAQVDPIHAADLGPAKKALRALMQETLTPLAKDLRDIVPPASSAEVN